MTSAALKQNYQQTSFLRIDKSHSEYQKEVKQLTGIAWQIAYTALWNTMEFSTREKAAAMKFIKGFIDQPTGHRKAYKEFVQRILLARLYVNHHEGTYIPIPTKWFNVENQNGFAGTKRWYDNLIQYRDSLPDYKIVLKAFAEAVEETVTSNNPADFHYWRSYFVERNTHLMLNLFLSTLANYNNDVA